MGAENGGSTGTVRRRSGYAKVNGISTAQWEDVHVDLPLRIAGSEKDGATITTEIGSTKVTRGVRTASVPACTSNLRDDDLIDITAGENAGTVVRIIEADWQDQATAKRFPIVFEQRPREWSA